MLCAHESHKDCTEIMNPEVALCLACVFLHCWWNSFHNSASTSPLGSLLPRFNAVLFASQSCRNVHSNFFNHFVPQGLSNLVNLSHLWVASGTVKVVQSKCPLTYAHKEHFMSIHYVVSRCAARTLHLGIFPHVCAWCVRVLIEELPPFYIKKSAVIMARTMPLFLRSGGVSHR